MANNKKTTLGERVAKLEGKMDMLVTAHVVEVAVLVALLAAIIKVVG